MNNEILATQKEVKEILDHAFQSVFFLWNCEVPGRFLECFIINNSFEVIVAYNVGPPDGPHAGVYPNYEFFYAANDL